MRDHKEQTTSHVLASIPPSAFATAAATAAAGRGHASGATSNGRAQARKAHAKRSGSKVRATVIRKDASKREGRKKLNRHYRRGAEGAGIKAAVSSAATKTKDQITGGFEAVGAGVKKGAGAVGRGVAHAGSAVANAGRTASAGTKSTFRKLFGNKDGEIGYFAPKTYQFWRALVVCFCMMTLLGHFLEIPYCMLMDGMFGIVDDTYPVWTDPWYHPYWVYGVGAVIMTLFIEPFKERLVVKRKTLWGAMLQCFVIMVALCAAMECIIGWLVNQPDPVTGVYPFWDNSQLPGNIFGQAWIVNDIAIAFAAMIYVWLVYPLVCRALSWLRPKVANIAAGAVVAVFAGCCVASYWQLISMGALG